MISQQKPQRSIQLKSRLLPGMVLILLGLQMFFPFKGWAILLTGFGGLWLLSYLWARSLLKGLQIERELRFGWKQVGDRLREHIILENDGWAPSLWVEIDDHSTMDTYDISSVTDVRAYRQRNWHTQGFCDTRGLYTLGPVTLRAQDPFGVYEVTVDYTNSANMMVAPPVIALPEIEIASGGRVGEGRSSNKGIEQTISTVGVREYVPGDSLRFLHWPTVARMGKMYVHLFDNEPSSDWWVLLDMDATAHIGEGARSTVEHGVILAASLANRGLQAGKHVGLISYGDDLIWHPPDFGDGHLWTILRSLAAIHPGGPSLDQILLRLRTSLDQNTSLVIITANVSPEWISALDLLKRSGIIPTVLIFDPVSFGGTEPVEPFRKRLRKLGITHYTISADLLDEPKKRPQGLRWLIEQTRLRDQYVDKWAARWQKIRQLLRTWVLIFIFFYLMANLLGAAVRGLETDLIWYLIGGSALTSWLLARSPLPGWLAAIISGLLGGILTILRVGNLGFPLLNASKQAFVLLGQALANAFRQADPVDFSVLQLQWAEIWQNLSGLATRIWEWFLALLRGQPYYDPVSITVLWGLLIWATVAWAIWYIFRHEKPFQAFVPAISLVAIALALGGQNNYDLAFLFGATVALMAFVNHDAHERRWVHARLSFTETIRTRVFVIAGLVTVVLIVFSLVMPAISLDYLSDLAHRLLGTQASNPEFAESLGIHNQGGTQEADILDLRGEGGLPNQHLIGSNTQKLSEQVVMVVRVDASQSGIPADQLAEVLSPLYLRSLVYDRYIGTGWASRDTEIVDYVSGNLIPTAEQNARLIRQDVQFVDEVGNFLYTLGTPLSTNRDFRVAWRIQSDSSQVYDLFGATVAGDSYRADSLVQIHSIDELRTAGQNYPGWMVTRYMSLPASVPENVLTLARDLTAIETNPYDRAVAIESYLRQYPYTLNVSIGPAGIDITEYFLFSLRKGYCDYYATAMVVLARAAGMPARYVIGYIGEHYDAEREAYVITADEAHAWAEIYFPGYGWIQFEPTAGRPAIERPPEALPELPADLELDFGPLVPEPRFSFENWLLLLGIALALFILTVVLVWILSDLWLARQPIDRQLPRLYRRLYRYERRLRLPSEDGETPYEFAALLQSYLQQLSSGSYWSEWLQSGLPLIQQISDAYVYATYNPASRRDMDAKELFNSYRQLRPRLGLLWFLGWVYKYWFLRAIFWREAPLLIHFSPEKE